MNAKAFIPLGTVYLYNSYMKGVEINYLRIFFAASTLLSLAVFAALYYLIDRKNERASVTVKTKVPMGEETVETLPAAEYDRRECKSAVFRTLMTTGIVGGLHYYKNFEQPLLVSGVMALVGLLDDPLFNIYLLGRPATGKLQRPFVKPSPFAAFTDAKAKAEEAAAAASGSSSAAEDKSKAVAVKDKKVKKDE